MLTEFEAKLIKHNQHVHALRLISARMTMDQAFKILDKYLRYLKFQQK